MCSMFDEGRDGKQSYFVPERRKQSTMKKENTRRSIVSGQSRRRGNCKANKQIVIVLNAELMPIYSGRPSWFGVQIFVRSLVLRSIYFAVSIISYIMFLVFVTLYKRRKDNNMNNEP